MVVERRSRARRVIATIALQRLGVVFPRVFFEGSLRGCYERTFGALDPTFHRMVELLMHSEVAFYGCSILALVALERLLT